MIEYENLGKFNESFFGDFEAAFKKVLESAGIFWAGKGKNLKTTLPGYIGSKFWRRGGERTGRAGVVFEGV